LTGGAGERGRCTVLTHSGKCWDNIHTDLSVKHRSRERTVGYIDADSNKQTLEWAREWLSEWVDSECVSECVSE